MRVSVFVPVTCAAVLCCTAALSLAQPPGPPPGAGGPPALGGFLRMLPVMAALDADEDGEISEKEIENAVAALKTLDKNKDGKLTEDELRPDFRGFGGGRGPGGPSGFPGGFGGQRPGGLNLDVVVDRIMSYDKDEDSKLSKDELPAQMQSLLTRADKDEDGFVTRDELSALMTRESGEGGGRGRFGLPGAFGGPPIPPLGADFVTMIMSQDKNKDGKLTKDELPEFMQDRFSNLDANDDGALDKEEIEKMRERFRSFGGPGGFGGSGRRPSRDRPNRPPVEE